MKREAKGLIGVWVALLALLGVTIAAATLELGAWNTWIGLLLASAKTVLIVWFFMHLRRSAPAVRFAAVAGFAMLAILAALTLFDYLTRG